MATHSSILAWRIPWTEEPGELQSMILIWDYELGVQISKCQGESVHFLPPNQTEPKHSSLKLQKLPHSLCSGQALGYPEGKLSAAFPELRASNLRGQCWWEGWGCGANTITQRSMGLGEALSLLSEVEAAPPGPRAWAPTSHWIKRRFSPQLSVWGPAPWGWNRSCDAQGICSSRTVGALRQSPSCSRTQNTFKNQR